MHTVPDFTGTGGFAASSSRIDALAADTAAAALAGSVAIRW